MNPSAPELPAAPPGARRRWRHTAAAALAAVVFGLGGLLLPPVPAHATTMRRATIGELAQQAARVFHGTVTALEATRSPAGRPETRIEFMVAATWKGDATNRLTLMQAGATLGDRRVVVVGDATFQLGEEVVVFAVERAPGEWVTLGLAQGKFAVTHSPTGTTVSNGLWGGPPPAPGAPGWRPATQLPLSLDELRRRVQEAGQP